MISTPVRLAGCYSIFDVEPRNRHGLKASWELDRDPYHDRRSEPPASRRRKRTPGER